jgi:6-phosphogluconolactonase/glucosamine-6-phosphate isomerase/deaminase
LLDENTDRPILFRFSGGSSLNLLPLIDTSNLNSNITFAVFDERYSYDEKVNNFLQMMFLENFYTRAVENGCHFISTYPLEMESIDELADRFEVDLRKWKRNNPEGIVIATIGIGSNGHVSGAMPYPENEIAFNEMFVDTDRWVVGYDALDKDIYHLRITSTLAYIKNNIDEAVIYACGDNKIEAMERVFAENGSLAETPSRIIHEMKSIKIFTDLNKYAA